MLEQLGNMIHPIKTIGLFAVAFLVSNSASYSQDQRLGVAAPDEAAARKITIEGVVETQNKYSIVVAGENKKYRVNISNDTDIILQCSTPRVDFENTKVVVPISGADRKFREYKFKKPLFIRAQFAHQKQYQRVMKSDDKRLSHYRISNEPFAAPAETGALSLTGELKPGESDRKLKLQTGPQAYSVLLAKNGFWSGFTLLDLQAAQTYVRVTGVLTDDPASSGDQVNAVEIVFYPVISSDDEPTKNETVEKSSD